jgi:hypothetical protein
VLEVVSPGRGAPGPLPLLLPQPGGLTTAPIDEPGIGSGVGEGVTAVERVREGAHSDCI